MLFLTAVRQLHSDGRELVQCSIDSNSTPSLSSLTPLGLLAPWKGVLL